MEFVLFAFTSVGVAVFHQRTLRVALIGLLAIILYKLFFTGFRSGSGVAGLLDHLSHEWVILSNLLLLLMGFAVLTDYFGRTNLPALLPRILPHDWNGGFILLTAVWILSSFLDNIAGALIGGATTHGLFRGKVHVGFIAAIVAAANAGGAWSVVGDTTTTMMWIAGVPPSRLLPAILPALIALLIFGVPAAIQQQRHSPILKRAHKRPSIDWVCAAGVVLVLAVVIATNVTINLVVPNAGNHFPFVGCATWIAISACLPLRLPNWSLLAHSFRSSVFLLALIVAASLMPVERLPAASWETTFGLGFLSAVFDNIPLTALALKHGGYDWAFLAYTVGFGGSMVLVRLIRWGGIVQHVP